MGLFCPTGRQTLVEDLSVQSTEMAWSDLGESQSSNRRQYVKAQLRLVVSNRVWSKWSAIAPPEQAMALEPLDWL